MLKVFSSAFAFDGIIPKKYTCDGDDINPEINIEEIPESTKSLVLIFDDPDSPSGTWDHWLVWNINPDIKKIDENSVPEGAVFGENTFGKLAYGGPCPGFGTHRYYFKIYALDTVLDLQEGAGRADLENTIKGHIIEEGQLMGKYSR